ncbi:hypothetical protein [Georgenia yuyongxinii]|uniref:Uncharacterized protein n=1 Tax=Georgenia yuyongxinii TaxID=2589797 RepID=A0A552WX99_9MICO|nr:hypothetical protein [Georgenia yuyongxinii]TRW47442.1 hypothetical protein FJ693_01175 [Georgenia yuyongxinii]
MTRLWITVTMLTALVVDRLADPPPAPDSERGSVTIEHVLWAVAVIAIVGIVVVAITTYVQNQAAEIG